MKEINRERFKAWLFAQDPKRAIVFGSCTDCFMGLFIKETTNHEPEISADS